MLAILLFLLALADLRLLTSQPSQYELVEIEVATYPTPKNPFDPNEAHLDATVSLPSGRTFRVPGFWYQDFRRSISNPGAAGVDRVEQLDATGRPGWRIRFASPEAGLHRVAVEWKISGESGRSQPIELRIQPGSHPGFIRKSPRNPHYLEHDSGRPFFPIGENLWPGLGRYDLASAWRLDHVAAECQRRDIYYQLTFEMTVLWQTRLFHDTIWASALSGAAGTGLYWWWHNYVEPLDLYRHYKPLARFLQDEDLPARTWSPVGLSRPNIPVSLNIYGLTAPDRALLWIHDPLAFRIIDGKSERGPNQAAASLNVTGLADGEYEVQWWDTIRGEILRQDPGRVRRSDHFGYGLELKPPPFWRDIAVRVTRKAQQ